MKHLRALNPEVHLANLAAALACLRIGIRLGARTSILGGSLSTLGLFWLVWAVALGGWQLADVFDTYRRRRRAGTLTSHESGLP